MTYDKDSEKFELWLRTYCFQAPPERDYQLMKDVWLESAEQARKEAAERAVKFVDNNYNAFGEWDNVAFDNLRAAILGDPAPVSTDSEKLAIAVKALEDIREMRCGDSWKVAHEALKEIQE